MNTNYMEIYKPVKLNFNFYSPIDVKDLPPVILVAGFLVTHATWNKVKCQIGDLTKRKVYSIELRNHGKSESSEEFTLQHMVSDMLLFMDDQKIQRAVLVGHSAGGKVVMELALTKPELVEKLIVEEMSLGEGALVSNVAKVYLEMMKDMQQIVSQLPPYMSEMDAYKTVKNIIVKNMHKFLTDESISEVLNMQFIYKVPETGEFKFNCNLGVINKSMTNLNIIMANNLSNDPKYNGKTLFIKVEHSCIPIEKEIDLIFKHFPQAQFTTVKKVFHSSHVETPEEFTRKVVDFILS